MEVREGPPPNGINRTFDPHLLYYAWTDLANELSSSGALVADNSLTQSGTLSPLPVITIGGVAGTVQFAGLVAPGEFQFNVVIPGSLANGDQTLTATYGGAATQAGALITVHN